MGQLLIKNCERIVTMDESAGRPIHKQRDILITDNRIERIGVIDPAQAPGARVLDGTGLTAIPGLIQTHIHLCQSPFRNTADDTELMDWLSQYIWPGEARLDQDSLKLAARVGIGELLLGGTTCILDMATLRHTNSVFEALDEAGMRAISGKCMMDDTDICPPELVEDTAAALRETRELIERWHGHKGRLGVAITPRFAVSCTTELMKECIKLSEEHGLLIHTHASENRGEIELVRKKTGYGNLEYFEQIGLLSNRACLAHCVHLEDGDLERLKKYDARILHCPSSNLKLASGIAPIPTYLDEGLCVSLGADGAPCNNLLDMFSEMRLAALIHKPGNGPKAMPADQVFEMATLQGAKALGMANEIGQVRPGFKADIALVDLNQHHNLPSHNVYASLVYASRASDVRHVVVDGEIRVRDGKLTFGEIRDWLWEFASLSNQGKM